MNKIKVYTGYSNAFDHYYYEFFEIVDEIPSIGDVLKWDSQLTETVTGVEKMTVEGQQPKDECYNYNYYQVTTQVIENEYDGTKTETTETHLYAVEIPDVDYTRITGEFKAFCAYETPDDSSDEFEWFSDLLDTWLGDEYGDVILNTEEKEEIINDILSERETV